MSALFKSARMMQAMKGTGGETRPEQALISLLEVDLDITLYITLESQCREHVKKQENL